MESSMPGVYDEKGSFEDALKKGENNFLSTKGYARSPVLFFSFFVDSQKAYQLF